MRKLPESLSTKTYDLPDLRTSDMVPPCDHLPDLASCMRTFWPGISGVSSIPPLDILAFCFFELSGFDDFCKVGF